MGNALGGARGCGGGRTKGDVYFETGFGPDGRPVEDFLIDPPVPVPDAILANRDAKLGVRLLPRGDTGIWDIWDGIGSAHYPHVADFVEETRRMGISRKLAKSLDFQKITRQSRLLVWHSRASVLNWSEYGPYECPKGLAEHDPYVRLKADGPCCCGFWWHDLTPEPDREPDRDGTVERSIANTTYRARPRRPEVHPIYVPALFGSFPCTRLAVVKGGDGSGIEKARRSGVPVEETDE